LKANGFEKLAISIVLAQSWMLGVLSGDAGPTVGSSQGIQAASCSEPMLQVEPATLKVPTPGLLRLCTLHAPQLKAALLHQVCM